MSEDRSSLLGQLFQIRRGEYRLVILMFSALLCGVTAFVIGRAVRDALFLSRHGTADLPYVYMMQAVVVGAFSYLYSRIADRRRRDRIIVMVSLFLATTLFGLRFLVTNVRHEFVFAVLYVWIEVCGALLLIQFWTLANDLFHPREAKRLFGLIGAGSVIAGATGGFAVRYLAGLVPDTADLLILASAFVALMVLAVFLVGRTARDRLVGSYLLTRPGRSRMHLKRSSASILGEPHLMLIAGIIGLTFISTTLVDYEFKILSRSHYAEAYPDEPAAVPVEGVVERVEKAKPAGAERGAISPEAERQLTIFFGQFYGWTGLIACLFQLLVTGRLLKYRFASLLFLPATLFLGSAALALRPGLAGALVGKFADTAFRYTVNDSATQILYQPVRKAIVGRAKAFIEGILKPLSIGAAGGLVLLFSLDRSPAMAGWIILVVVLGWIALIPMVNKRYHTAMVSSLFEHRLDLSGAGVSIAGSRAEKEIEAHLDHDDDDHVQHVLEILPRVKGANFSGSVALLLTRDSHAVRREALRYLSQHGDHSHLAQILPLFVEEDRELRAEAVRAYCAVGGEQAIRTVKPLLRDPARQVKAAAVSGLIRHGGLDGILEAAAELKSMLESEEPADREQAAAVLRVIGVRTFYRQVLSLFSDPVTEVRIAALRAAGEMRSPELLPSLIYKLGDRAVAPAAVAALVSYDSSAVQALGRVLGEDREQQGIRAHAARALGEIASQEAVDLLVEQLDDPTESIRLAATRALVHARRVDPTRRVPPEPALAQIRTELRDYYQWLAAEEDLKRGNVEVVLDALAEKRQGILTRVFGLLGLFLDAREVDAIWEKLKSGDVRLKANAIEAVEYLLLKHRELKRALMPIIDPEHTAEQITRGGRVFEAEIKRDSAEDWLARLLEDPSEWVIALALHAIGLAGARGLADPVVAHLSSESELIRESALFAASRLGNAVDLEYLLSRHAEDPSPAVARAAQALAAGATS